VPSADLHEWLLFGDEFDKMNCRCAPVAAGRGVNIRLLQECNKRSALQKLNDAAPVDWIPLIGRAMDKKEIKKKVNELIASGVPKSDVFEQLSGQGAKDNQLALFIASYADPRLCVEYDGKVSILVTLMLIQSLLGFFAGYGIGASMGPIAQWIFGVMVAFIPLLFALGFYKHFAGTYNAYILLTIIQLPKQIAGLATAPAAATAIALLVNLGILAYVWYVRKKIFPDFGLFSPKKSNGQYVFS
jgi:hypothetical protein